MLNFPKAEQLIQEEKYQQALAELMSQPLHTLDEEGFTRLEGCLSAIPQQVRQQSPEGCFLSLSEDLRRGRLRSARQWYTQLAVLRDQQREGTRERAVIVQYTCRAGIMMPQTDNAQMLLLLSILHNETVNYKLPPVTLNATGRRPSVLRGTKDLSEWGRNYRAVANIVRSLQESVLPDGGEGAVAAAVAELLYERNDLNAASMEVAGALAGPDAEVIFAGYAQLARIARLDGSDSRRSGELLTKLGELLRERGAAYLEGNYRALCVRFDIHYGRLEPVREWLEQEGDDSLEACCLDNVYELMTQAKALIALGRCREAVTLLERLLLVLREDFRPLDTAECLVDSAIAFELLGSRDLAMDKLEEALLTAAPYRYVRVVADGGRAVFQLLNLLGKDSRRGQDLPASYLRGVLEAAKNYSMLFPLLYSHTLPPEKTPESAPDLTAAELQVLQLLEEGKSNNQIREQMGIKLSTVKFHLTNLFEKLGASSRLEAVKLAKKLQIL